MQRLMTIYITKPEVKGTTNAQQIRHIRHSNNSHFSRTYPFSEAYRYNFTSQSCFFGQEKASHQ